MNVQAHHIVINVIKVLQSLIIYIMNVKIYQQKNIIMIANYDHINYVQINLNYVKNVIWKLEILLVYNV